MSTLSSATLLRNTLKDVSTKLRAGTTVRTMASGKEIRFGVEGRAAMLRGVDLLADAVQVSYEVLLLYLICRCNRMGELG